MYLDLFKEPDRDLRGETDRDLRGETDLDLRGDTDLDLYKKKKGTITMPFFGSPIKRLTLSPQCECSLTSCPDFGCVSENISFPWTLNVIETAT